MAPFAPPHPRAGAYKVYTESVTVYDSLQSCYLLLEKVLDFGIISVSEALSRDIDGITLRTGESLSGWIA